MMDADVIQKNILVGGRCLTATVAVIIFLHQDAGAHSGINDDVAQVNVCTVPPRSRLDFAATILIRKRVAIGGA